MFNPAIGNLIGLWGFHSDEFKPCCPIPRKLKALVTGQPAMSDIVVEGIAVPQQKPRRALDLGGYAKGYALDRGGGYLRAQG